MFPCVTNLTSMNLNPLGGDLTAKVDIGNPKVVSNNVSLLWITCKG